MKELIKDLYELQTLEFVETVQPDTEERIAELRAKIPLPILSHYDRLTARGKKGVSVLKHQTCSGCHMCVPLGVVVDLKHGEDLRICEHCGRYLYLREEAEEETDETPKKAVRRKGIIHLEHAV